MTSPQQHSNNGSFANTSFAGHYTSVADDYNDMWFYENPDYNDRLRAAIADAILEHHPTPRFLVDVGGGTGVHTRPIADALGLDPKKDVVVLEPSPEMAAKAQASGIRCAVSTLEECVVAEEQQQQQQQQVVRGADVYLFKESVHHIDVAHRRAVFAALHDDFIPDRTGGVVVLTTRPCDATHIPMFPAAWDAWRDGQPCRSSFESDLRAAGFDIVSAAGHRFAYSVSMPLRQWVRMVRSRFWSNFSGLSEAEMEQGVQFILSSHAANAIDNVAGHDHDGGEDEDDAIITFPDIMEIIVARKKMADKP
eukprot:PhM_4_TR13339/c6_g1_i2/m.17551